jgi:tetratricopeptide (TPR) repeat protein
MIGFGQTSLDYFYKAHNYVESEESQLAIDNYTKFIKSLVYWDEKFVAAYFYRGLEYAKLGNHKEAINDYTVAFSYAEYDAIFPIGFALCQRGTSFFALGNNKDAIADFTRAIEIDSDDYGAYFGRAKVKYSAGLPYCSDYQRACDLGCEYCCGAYAVRCYEQYYEQKYGSSWEDTLQQIRKRNANRPK